MGYEKDVLARARRRYADSVEQHAQQRRQQLEDVYEEYPRVRELDIALRSTMAEVMNHAFRHGEDPTAAVRNIRRKNQALQQERAMILEQAGYREEELAEGPLCRKCGDTGYVGETMCECFRAFCQEEQRNTLTSLLSGETGDFDEFSLDYYSTAIDPNYGISPREQMEMIYETCVNYARKFSMHSRSLLMNGGTGLGKTFLSACIAKTVVGLGHSVVYDTAIHVFSCLEKQKFGGATPEEKRMAERVMECDLLILDDLGTEMATAFVAPALYSIVNGRLLEGKPTIISSNLSLGELSRRYSPQIASRLMGEYINLVFLGRDIRLQRANGG